MIADPSISRLLRQDAARIAGVLALALALLAPVAATRARPLPREPDPTATGPVRLVQVEAAFLINFLRFTQWPQERLPTDSEPYIVAVVGDDDVAGVVRNVANAAGSVQGHRIGVVNVDPRDVERGRAQTLDILRGSHLVFVKSDDRDVSQRVFTTLQGTAVLTVGDTPNFAARGGMLGLVRSGSHLALEANRGEMQSAGVQVSAKVIKLARILRSRT